MAQRLLLMKINRFEDLHAWQEARVLVRLLYDMTNTGPFKNDRDLVRQARRAAVSVMANIAEGFSRYSFKDSKQLFVTSRGSLAELKSHVCVATDQSYCSEEEARGIFDQIDVVGKLVSGLIRNSVRRIEVSASDLAAIEPMSH